MICEKIARGAGLIKICDEAGMPSYPMLCRWRRQHPEIDKALDAARRDRAEFHRDKAMAVVEPKLNDMDEVADAKLKHEAHKWAAGVDDQKFSPKSKVDVAVNTPTIIQISTGINREPIQSVIDRDVTPPNTSGVGDTDAKS